MGEMIILLKRKIKKIIAVMAAALLALTLVPAVSFAAVTSFQTSNTDPAAGPTCRTVYRTFYLYGNGFPLVVEVNAEDATYTNIWWDKNNNGLVDTASDELVGRWQGGGVNSMNCDVYGGGYGTDVGDTKVTVLSGTVDGLYGAGGKGSVTGNQQLIVNNGTVADVYVSSPNKTAMVTGNSATFTQNGGTIKRIFSTIGQFSGDVTVNINDGTFATLYAVDTYNHVGSAKSIVMNVKGGMGSVIDMKDMNAAGVKFANGKAVLNFSGGTVEAIEGDAPSASKNKSVVNLSGNISVKAKTTSPYAAPGMNTAGLNEVNITNALTCPDGSILLSSASAGTSIVTNGATEANMVKFAVPGGVPAGMQLEVEEGKLSLETIPVPRTLTIDEQTFTIKRRDPLPTITPPAPPKGQMFDGYYDQPGGKGTKYYNADGSAALTKYPVDADVTLYAMTMVSKEGHDVQGRVINGALPVYKVDIGWGEMKFEYKKGALTWDPATHQYTGIPTMEWTGFVDGNNRITVKNHSNAAVNADFAFAGNELAEGINTDWFGDEMLQTKANAMNLTYCPLNAVDANVPSGVRYLQLTGEPIKLTRNDPFKVAGIITVTINADMTTTDLTPDT